MNKALRYAIFLFCGLLAPSSHAWDVSVVSQQTKPLSLEPGDPAWSQVAPVAVRLAPQKLLAPGGGGSVISVEVQSLRTQTDIYFRLRWADPKKDSKFELSDQFVDAAAVQFPLNAGQLPPPFMGAQGQPVNIWRWSAAMQEPDRFPQAYADYHRPDAIEKTVRYPDRPEDLVAEGFGTLGRRPSQAVEGNGAWSEGYWTVVLKRSLAVQGGAAFKNNTIVPVAFAVWDGSAGDRDGAKSFSVWQNLLLDRKVPTLAKNNIQRGRQVYARYGCAVCHGPAGKGGIPNPNAQIDPIPPLNRVAEGFTEEEVKTVVREGRIPGAKDPDGIQPQLWMNSWKNLMDEEELDALVDYLF
ncbi:MAG: c-type cytochrome, partial [Elusimicrobia bacterium]|nr:c-type cytochrome [Elusimicrobiota bacterium]